VEPAQRAQVSDLKAKQAALFQGLEAWRQAPSLGGRGTEHPFHRVEEGHLSTSCCGTCDAEQRVEKRTGVGSTPLRNARVRFRGGAGRQHRPSYVPGVRAARRKASLGEQNAPSSRRDRRGLHAALSWEKP